MCPRNLLALLLCQLLLAGPALAQAVPIATGPQCLQPAPRLDARKSLFVTEVDVVQNAISLEDVLTRLARESQIPGLQPIDLWQQWWDTQNSSPGLGLGANCDDFSNAQGDPALNGFPIVPNCDFSPAARVQTSPSAARVAARSS